MVVVQYSIDVNIQRYDSLSINALVDISVGVLNLLEGVEIQRKAPYQLVSGPGRDHEQRVRRDVAEYMVAGGCHSNLRRDETHRPRCVTRCVDHLQSGADINAAIVGHFLVRHQQLLTVRIRLRKLYCRRGDLHRYPISCRNRRNACSPSKWTSGSTRRLVAS